MSDLFLRILWKTALWIFAFTFQSSAWAQAEAKPIAWIESFAGEVLVRRQEQTLAATVEMPLLAGNIVATRAGASTIIRFDNGCKLRLPEQQALDIQGAVLCCDDAIPEGAIAHLDRVVGEVTVSRSGAPPQPGIDGLDLFAADTVQTGADSTTFIIYPDGCGVKIQPNHQHTLRFARECCIQGCLLPVTEVTVIAPNVAGAAAATGVAAGGAIIATENDNGGNNGTVLSDE